MRGVRRQVILTANRARRAENMRSSRSGRRWCEPPAGGAWPSGRRSRTRLCSAATPTSAATESPRSQPTRHTRPAARPRTEAPPPSPRGEDRSRLANDIGLTNPPFTTAQNQIWRAIVALAGELTARMQVHAPTGDEAPGGTKTPTATAAVRHRRADRRPLASPTPSPRPSRTLRPGCSRR
jgi:hypothetical protein